MVQNQMNVNLFGPWLMSKIFMPDLIESKGRIVNMISFCTECQLPTLSVYSASKAALMSLSVGMRMELSKHDVDVILFNPGDHPGETPLCYGQDEKYKQMETEVKQRFFKIPQVLKDFDSYQGKFTTIFPGRPKLAKLNSPGLYQNFDKIMLDDKPKTLYVNSDWKTRGFFGLVNSLPASLSDKIRTAIMKLPK